MKEELRKRYYNCVGHVWALNVTYDIHHVRTLQMTWDVNERFQALEFFRKRRDEYHSPSWHGLHLTCVKVLEASFLPSSLMIGSAA
jgi:hypothetical protein